MGTLGWTFSSGLISGYQRSGKEARGLSVALRSLLGVPYVKETAEVGWLGHLGSAPEELQDQVTQLRDLLSQRRWSPRRGPWQLQHETEGDWILFLVIPPSLRPLPFSLQLQSHFHSQTQPPCPVDLATFSAVFPSCVHAWFFWRPTCVSARVPVPCSHSACVWTQVSVWCGCVGVRALNPNHKAKPKGHGCFAELKAQLKGKLFLNQSLEENGLVQSQTSNRTFCHWTLK